MIIPFRKYTLPRDPLISDTCEWETDREAGCFGSEVEEQQVERGERGGKKRLWTGMKSS